MTISILSIPLAHFSNCDGTLVIDASDIDMRGMKGWPDIVRVETTNYFRSEIQRDDEGDLEFITYESLGDKLLKIFND